MPQHYEIAQLSTGKGIIVLDMDTWDILAILPKNSTIISALPGENRVSLEYPGGKINLQLGEGQSVTTPSAGEMNDLYDVMNAIQSELS